MPRFEASEILVVACSDYYVVASITDFVSLYSTLYVWEASSRRQIHRVEFDFSIEKLAIQDSRIGMVINRATATDAIETLASFFDISDGRNWSFPITRGTKEHDGPALHLAENGHIFFVCADSQLTSFDANGIVSEGPAVKPGRRPNRIDSMIFADGEVLLGVTYYSAVKRFLQRDLQRYEGNLLTFDENLHLKSEVSLGITDTRQELLLAKHPEIVVVCQRLQNLKNLKSRLLYLDGNSHDPSFAIDSGPLDGLYAEGILFRNATNLGLLCLIPYLHRPHPILCTINIANGTTTKDDILPLLHDDEFYNHFFVTRAVIITLRDSHSANLTSFRMIDMVTLASSEQYEFVDS